MSDKPKQAQHDADCPSRDGFYPENCECSHAAWRSSPSPQDHTVTPPEPETRCIRIGCGGVVKAIRGGSGPTIYKCEKCGGCGKGASVVEQDTLISELLDAMVTAIDSYWTDGCNDQEASEQAVGDARAAILERFQRQSAELERLQHEVRGLRFDNTCLQRDRLLMAKLAAETPQFSNPLVAWEAQNLRDIILEANARRETTDE